MKKRELVEAIVNQERFNGAEYNVAGATREESTRLWMNSNLRDLNRVINHRVRKGMMTDPRENTHA